MEEGKVSACSAAEDTSAKEEIWCLRRVGTSSDCLRLFEDTEVTLGRSFNVTYNLLSRSCPLMISRQHCVFKQNDDGQWTITDKKSLNGVWVNGERVAPDRAWPLSAGDTVRLGFPVEGTPVEFEYVLVRDALQAVRPFLVPPRAGAEPRAAPRATPRAKKPKRKLEEAEPETEQSRAKLFRGGSEDRSLTGPCPLTQTQSGGEVPGPSVPATGPHSNLSPANLRHRGESDSSRPGAERDRRLDDSLCCEEVGRSLQEEQQLKKRLEEALQEQRKVMEELKCSRRGFEQILQAKDKELEVTKEEKEQARAQKDEVVIQMTDVLENELQCIICSELFIEAVTLSCAHSFCLHCIEAWRQRSVACPICRRDILSQTRSLVLDNCIDRMLESLSAELKERRQELIAQRKVQPAADPVVVISDEESHGSSSISGSSLLDFADTFDESELFSDSLSLASLDETSLSLWSDDSFSSEDGSSSSSSSSSSDDNNA